MKVNGWKTALLAFCDLDQFFKGCRRSNGDLGDHLAVDLDLGIAEALDEPAIRNARIPAGGADTVDP